jgi:hypothetical protein
MLPPPVSLPPARISAMGMPARNADLLVAVSAQEHEPSFGVSTNKMMNPGP